MTFIQFKHSLAKRAERYVGLFAVTLYGCLIVLLGYHDLIGGFVHWMMLAVLLVLLVPLILGAVALFTGAVGALLRSGH